MPKSRTPGPFSVAVTNSGTFIKSETVPGYFVDVRHVRGEQDPHADALFIARAMNREHAREMEALLARWEDPLTSKA
jgi:hypothetical protein